MFPPLVRWPASRFDDAETTVTFSLFSICGTVLCPVHMCSLGPSIWCMLETECLWPGLHPRLMTRAPLMGVLLACILVIQFLDRRTVVTFLPTPERGTVILLRRVVSVPCMCANTLVTGLATSTGPHPSVAALVWDSWWRGLGPVIVWRRLTINRLRRCWVAYCGGLLCVGRHGIC